MEEVIVLINLNSYLGGGETLLVRFATYLAKSEVNFQVVCMKGSFIETDLRKKGFDNNTINLVSTSPDYYYLSANEREDLLALFYKQFAAFKKVRIVTFCMRDLYTAFTLASKKDNHAVTHLILHVQDDLYLGQTLLDKFIYKASKKRLFSGKRNISFNRYLMNTLNNNAGLICMADIIAKVWKRNFNINIAPEFVVPLPSFNELAANNQNNEAQNKIIWIGRIVDFKIPAIIEMINFIAKNPAYSFTIVGDGNRDKILNYINDKHICLENISFLGEVTYSELGAIINSHSIGYGMGTSLVELAKHRLPVIVALAAYDHQLFKRQVCGGLFYNKSKGCDGSDLILEKEEDIPWTIESCVKEIETNYSATAEACYNFAKEGYSEKNNFSAYLSIIKHTELMKEDDIKTSVPYASFIRKFLYKIFKND